MRLSHINLSNLVISPANMRAKHKSRDIAELIPSVRARGVLVPLLVRPNGEPDMFEIVAGRRRFLAAKAVAETDGVTGEVPCAVMESGDDASALEASLIENVARLDADEVTQWETFARLIKDGRTADQIAATFGLPEKAVARILALGNLLPRIRALYRAEQMDSGTVRQLTMATTAQQREWLALFDSPDSYAPTGRVLKDWLFGGSTILTSAALFDLSDYTAPIVTDLFDERSYFSDSAEFWTLQNKAIEAKRESYQDAGWSDVVILPPGSWFESWTYEKRPRAKGGRVYIAVTAQGGVEVHEGYLPRKEVERAEKVGRADGSVERSELTAPLRCYLDLHRHAVVRAYLIEHPSLALRTMLAHVICGSGLWSVRRERQRADKPETEHSVANSRAQLAFGQRRAAMIERLGLEPDRNSIADGGDTGFSAVFATVANLPDEDLLPLVAIVMGETLEAGGEAIDLLGQLLKPEPSTLWEPDDAFFTLIRDRKVLVAILEEIAGHDVAEANQEASGKVLKAVIGDCLKGRNSRAKVEDWVPRWLQFPATTYFGPQTPEPNNDTVDNEAEPGPNEQAGSVGIEAQI
jgi:ParB family chromosome partitioning protein